VVLQLKIQMEHLVCQKFSSVLAEFLNVVNIVRSLLMAVQI
jgi:hypothetical protein